MRPTEQEWRRREIVHLSKPDEWHMGNCHVKQRMGYSHPLDRKLGLLHYDRLGKRYALYILELGVSLGGAPGRPKFERFYNTPEEILDDNWTID